MNRRARGTYFVAAGLLVCLGGGLLRQYHAENASHMAFEGDVRLESQLGWTESSWASIKPTKELAWIDCYEEGFECGRLQVPLNYSNPEGASAAIALIRIKANVSIDSAEYLGPILFNPGGPGGSGVDLVRGRGKFLATVVGPRFDIVGFDPRGVARSTPRVSFYETRAERELWSRSAVRELNFSSDTVASSWARTTITGQLAGERAMDVLPHIQTDHTARDMFTITEAHGREKIQYWGFSYGTVLGSTFAAIFPDKIHRLIIDGVVDVQNDYYTANWRDNLLNTDDTLRWFFKDCHDAGPEKCSFYESSAEAIGDRLNNLYKSIIRVPIPVRTGISYGLVDYARLRLTIFNALYKPFDKWATLATGLSDLEKGNGTVLYQMLEETLFSCSCDPLEHIFDSVGEAQTTIACNDGDVVPASLEEAEEHYKEILQVSEWGSIWAGLRFGCSSWPTIPKTFFRGPISGNTSYPILLIGNTADPVTPLHAAHVVSNGFPGSVVLSQHSAGHCSVAAPSLCTAHVVRDYFVNGTLPKPGTRCPIIGTPFSNETSASVSQGHQKQQPLETILTREDVELLQAWRQIGSMSNGLHKVAPLHV
ncbi:alpha beta hydrolase fold family [Moniliophthora roreri MCA 2997]|uniref:Alpha beta hydrolase fold family n=2 Tax=Moniliophthora roreri TaxID=221103 RepID=V2XER0_MONRO|nr:alpha beta hydrolase fold family [Moniliophthora roreri MCA 2997]